MYLIQVVYRNDNERKRLDYIINKWESKVTKFEGYLIKVYDEDTFRELLNEIISKFPPEAVKSYKIEEIEVQPQTVEVVKEFVINKSVKEVSTFINYLIAKNRGIYVGNVEGVNIYDIYTRKGIVRIYLSLREVDNKTHMNITYRGIEEAIDRVSKEFEREIKIFDEINQ